MKTKRPNHNFKGNCPKDAKGMANRENPDQTAPLEDV